MEALAEEQKIERGESDDNWEPCVGMVFESEDAARKFYVEYARRVGFAVRILDRRKSDFDGRTLALRMGCNKEGYKRRRRESDGAEEKKKKKKRNRGPSFREGCNAAILVKRERAEKRGVEMWMVSRFVKEHCHPLLASTNESGALSVDDKDKKIKELKSEIERQDQLCQAHRQKLVRLMSSVEQLNDELSLKVQVIVENVREIELGTQRCS